MTDRTPDGEATIRTARKWRRLDCAILGALCAWVIGVFDWSAKPGMWELSGMAPADTYYNLLVRGFQSGRLGLQQEVPPGLAQLADPYDPAANATYRSAGGMHDLSYYRGRLYLYYGVTPALVLFWPWYELSGHYLSHRDAVLIFCVVGFLAGVVLLVSLWRRYFSEVGLGVVGACVVALGLAGGLPLLLARSSVCEVPISCGYALAMVTVLLVWRALHDGQRRGWWLGGASLSYGLAVGARPSLLLGAVILLLPVVLAWRQAVVSGQRPQIWTLLVWVSGPIMFLGLGLMAYNYLRFDHPFEFGQRYQLSAFRQDRLAQFSLGYLWTNVRVGFLEPARWGVQFPFVRGIGVGSLPLGYNEVGNAYGVLTNMPLVWVGILAPLAWRGRVGEGRLALRALWVAWLLLFGAGALVLCLHNSMNLRYELEYAVPLVWFGVLGILGVQRVVAGHPGWRRATRWGWGFLLAFSVAFNLLARFQLCAETYFNLGSSLVQQGRVSEAIAHYQQALRLKADYPDAHNNLGVILFQKDRLPEAIGHFQEALRLQPDYADAHNNLGAALSPDQLPEAMAHYREALRLKPDYVEAHLNVGLALFQQGRAAEAIRHLQQAVRFKPDHAEAHHCLARVLATAGDASVRDGARAVINAEQALRLSGGNDARILGILAAAYAEAGRFGDAVRTAEAAIDLANAAGQAPQARQIQERLQLYQAGRPYHEGSTPAP